MKLAKELGRNTDPNVRQKLAKLYTMQQLGKFSSLRSKSPSQRTGGEPNIAKLMMSDLLRLQREVGHEILGASGMVMGRGHARRWRGPGGHAVLAGSVYLRRHRPDPAHILGERVLGLPKEPGPPKDTAYKDLLVNT